MSILPSGDQIGGDKVIPPLTLASEFRAASRFLHAKDPTGGLLATVLFMDGVEDWVLSRLPESEADNEEEVRTRLRRLSEILTQHRNHVPPDNYALLQLLTWMNASVAFYTLDYLTQAQPDFTVQFIRFCQANSRDEVNASLALERIAVLFRARLLDRVFSPDNFNFVTSVLLELTP